MSLPSRRGFVFGLPATLAFAQQQQQPQGRGQTFSSDVRRYADAATEFTVYRLTSPAYTSALTAYYNRAMSGRNLLYFSSDRTGRMEVYRMDIRNGQMRQLTAAAKLDPSSIVALSGDRSILFFDGPSLRQLTVGNLKEREVYRVPDGSERVNGFSVSGDGSIGYFIEKAGERYRLRAVNLLKGQATTLHESNEPLADPIPRPGRAEVLYRRGNSWRVGDTTLPLAPGEARTPSWTPDGASILYLNVSPERGQLNTIRELSLESSTNKLISKTSQFAGFGANADGSVFVGASGSKASPYVLLLIRNVQRELTLCEHRAQEARMVAPVFAPSSQRILFTSDQHGKPAIYTMNVERFVEETES